MQHLQNTWKRNQNTVFFWTYFMFISASKRRSFQIPFVAEQNLSRLVFRLFENSNGLCLWQSSILSRTFIDRNVLQEYGWILSFRLLSLQITYCLNSHFDISFQALPHSKSLQNEEGWSSRRREKTQPIIWHRTSKECSDVSA